MARAEIHQVLQNIEYVDYKGRVAVHLHLSERFAYRKHFPSRENKTFEINVSSVDLLDEKLPQLERRGVLLAPVLENVPLVSVTYEVAEKGAVNFILRFFEDTNITVRSSADLRTLIVTLPNILFPREAKDEAKQAENNLSDQLDRLKKLMTLGRTALKSGSSNEASAIFTDLLSLPTHPYMSEAEKLRRVANSSVGGRPFKLMDELYTIEQVEPLFIRGKELLKGGAVHKAIVIFTKLMQITENPYTRDSLEMLGVARQRNNQLAHAKAVYRDYITRYPEGEGTIRVKQRLAELLSLGATPKMGALNMDAKKVKTQGKYRVDRFGMFSQYYYRGEIEFDGNRDDRVDQSLLVSNVNYNQRWRSDEYDIRAFIQGNHRKDFLNNNTDSNGFDINNLYFESKNIKRGYYYRVGRQPASTAGALGRFDGFVTGYRPTKRTRVNLLGGFPVEFSDNGSINTDTRFIGATVEFASIVKNVDFVPYYYQQWVDGVIDRKSIGQELRYLGSRGSVFNMIDYDVEYEDLNIFLLNGQMNYSKQLSLFANFDYRNNPLISSSNAITNESGVNTVKDYLKTRTIDELHDDAKDQTGSAKLATLGMGYYLSNQIQVTFDLTYTNQSYSDAAMIENSDLQSNEKSTLYSTRLNLGGLYKGNDMTILGVTYNDASRYDNVSLLMQTRAPFGHGWRIDGQLRADWRDENNGNKYRRLKPLLRMTYYRKRSFNIDLEAGYEFTNYSGNSTNSDSTRFLYSVGYRWMF